MTDRHAFPLSGGAMPVAADRTLFQFWAPDRSSVDLEIAGMQALAMHPEAEGWFRLEVPCGAGTRYRYRLSPDVLVPDPYSRAQADDIHDDSLVIDPGAYAWRNQDWRGRPWAETVIYECHAGLLGGYRGLMDRLPALCELGITALELMPVADFPGSRNWGYDGVLPFAPDQAYGTPEELKALIDRAHDLKMMVFLDVVYNHFGPDGNYLGQYASAFFRKDHHTPWGATIDFTHPVIRRFFIENALYWLDEYQFDGLRLDAVHAIPERDWLPELAAAVRDRFGDRHIHLMLENDHNDAGLLERDFAAQWNDDAHHALHVLLTGETSGYYADYAQQPAEMLRRCLQEGFAFQGEASPYRDGEKRGSDSRHLPPERFVLFLQNHDQIGNRAFGERLVNLTSPEKLRAATALMLLSPQIPMLFMGEEIGCREPFLFFTSYTGELAEAVRTGRRREFARFREFADEKAQQRIPDPNEPDTFQASQLAENAESDSWRAFYRELLTLRRREIAPRLAGAKAEAARTLSPAAIEASWRMGDGRVLTLAFNFGDETIPYTAPEGDRFYQLVSPSSPATLAAGSFLAILQGKS
ncbi:MAG: malto-oligosyltrehalose trehalohydrolase [Dongiaceae bacterium]